MRRTAGKERALATNERPGGGFAMFMTKGGMVVEKGLYWNPMDGQRVALTEEGILPGDEGRSYLKMSPLGLLVIAPLLGMMYVIFLPLFGIGVFLFFLLAPLIGTF